MKPIKNKPLDSEIVEEPNFKIKKRTHWIWIIPILTLALVAVVLYQTYTNKGDLIFIKFNSADNIALHKTKLKHKNLIIGEVETIEFTDNLKQVNVGVRVKPSMRQYLTDKSFFWLVKVQISITKISGLDTLLKGTYIDSVLSNEGQKTKNFIALKKHPTNLHQKGVSFKLISKEYSNLNEGSKLYIKDQIVGEIEKKTLSDDLIQTTFDVFINEPYDKYVNKNTIFWKMDTVNISLKSDNFKMTLAPLESMLLGGIRLKTMASSSSTLKVGDSFTLYQNIKKALDTYEQKSFKQTIQFVLFFEEVHGLKVGAPVKYFGIEVGVVKSIHLQAYPDENYKMKAPIVIELYPEKIKLTDNHNHKADIINAVEQKGLRLQLKTDSLLTGQLYVSFTSIKKPKKVKVVKDKILKLLILETTPQELTTIKNDFDKTMLEMQQSMTSFRKTSEETMLEFNKTMKSIRKLSDSIEKDPSQLIWGK